MVDFLSAIMSELNSNLAVGRRTIEDMLASGDYSYKTKSGSVVEVPKEQLEYLWSVCDDSERIRLRIPVFVSTDTSAERGAWKVEGSPEAVVIARILEKPMFREDMVRLYNPDLSDLKKKIPDSIMVVFSP